MHYAVSIDAGDTDLMTRGRAGVLLSCQGGAETRARRRSGSKPGQGQAQDQGQCQGHG